MIILSVDLAGYATGIFGKWHLGDEGPLAPGARGFDESLTFRGAAMSKYFDPELLHNGAKQSYHGYCMDIFTSAAVDFIPQPSTASVCVPGRADRS